MVDKFTFIGMELYEKKKRKIEKIYIDQWLRFKPYEKQVRSDEYYLHLYYISSLTVSFAVLVQLKMEKT
ncbi:hypothetical protein FHQ18_03935 [Deferribacter autotrophicus]|uniref:Uncharacterized protein n=1 Tax=Deferribacter autotrophicus TaxID=500465 RepID=A0A5A8F739_9BACT|nr:hypothetical protein [Deferribacter autotrophicus]KAA0259109.1 hypothetical protein FHQ18_03935 [Deferribacter autotrophicus]